jgi:hypothetical protein
MATPSTYLHLTDNLLIGYVGSTITAQISLTRSAVSTPILAVQNAQGLGYEIAPDPTNSGSLTYRYAPNLASTNTVLTFNNGNALFKSQSLYVAPLGGASVVDIVPSGSGDAYIAINTSLGQTRIAEFVDQTSKQGFITFYKSDDIQSTGTIIGSSTIRTQNLIVSTFSSLNAYINNINMSTAVVSTFVAKTAIISSLTYTTIVGPTILQVQTVVF